jgi:Protein of unknown function (DUF4230)
MAAVMVAGAFGAGYLMSRTASTPPWSGPAVLQSIQAMGQLRTVRHTYQQVFEVETAEEAEPTLAVFPGVSAVVHAATRNTALVSATGTVDAGMDLARVSIQFAPNETIVALPAVDVYSPDIRLHVHSQRSGVFWRDNNIAPTGESQARTRFRSLAIEAGITDEATKVAQAKLSDLLIGRGKPVRFIVRS